MYISEYIYVENTQMNDIVDAWMNEDDISISDNDSFSVYIKTNKCKVVFLVCVNSKTTFMDIIRRCNDVKPVFDDVKYSFKVERSGQVINDDSVLVETMDVHDRDVIYARAC